MLVNSKVFGQVEIDDSKIIEFTNGIIGFEQYKKYALIFDSEGSSSAGIMWLQSTDEASLAFPVINPLLVMDDYNPIVEDEALLQLGECNDEEYVILLVLTVPQQIQKMTVNLKAPIIVNSNTKNAIQIIVENDEYAVRYPIYDILAAKKAGE